MPKASAISLVVLGIYEVEFVRSERNELMVTTHLRQLTREKHAIGLDTGPHGTCGVEDLNKRANTWCSPAYVAPRVSFLLLKLLYITLASLMTVLGRFSMPSAADSMSYKINW